MKRLMVLLIVLFLFLRANPVAQKIGFSEVQIHEPDNWQIEIYSWFHLGNEDSLFIGANSSIEKIINFNDSNLVVIDQDDFENTLVLNPGNDFIKLLSSDHSCIDSLKIGSCEGAYIHDLDSTQSVSCGMIQGDMYYKDNSPTIGDYNDTNNTNGTIFGYFYDKDGTPIKDKYVMIYDGDFIPPSSEYIDSTGYYSAKLASRYYCYDQFYIWRPYIGGDDWSFVMNEFDLEPDDSLRIDFYASQTGIKPVIKNDIIKFNNYPHPASSYTWFYIDNTQVEASAMRVNVYALNGRKVDSFIPTAKQFRYDCAHLPQGSYVMTLQHGNEVLATKKLQVLK